MIAEWFLAGLGLGAGVRASDTVWKAGRRLRRRTSRGIRIVKRKCLR